MRQQQLVARLPQLLKKRQSHKPKLTFDRNELILQLLISAQGVNRQ